MAPASTIGRHALSTRFTANVRIIYIDYPTKDELSIIYKDFSESLLSKKLNLNNWIAES